MSTFKELAYMVQDELKLLSDDATYTLDHIVFLLNKYRNFLLHEKYVKGKLSIDRGNLEVITVPLVKGKSEKKIPQFFKMLYPKVYAETHDDIAYTNYDRYKNTGYNKYLKRAIYSTIDYNNYLLVKGNNIPNQVYLAAVFQDTIEAQLFNSPDKDTLDCNINLEESLVAQLIQLVVKDLLGASYRPKDDVNNANDDLSDMMSFIRRNMKSNMQKQLED